MIIIAILFSIILSFEWNYLKQRKRKKRTFLIVIGMVAFLFISMEGLYYFKEQMAIAKVIEMVFNPAEKFLRIGE